MVEDELENFVDEQRVVHGEVGPRDGEEVGDGEEGETRLCAWLV